MQRSSRALVVGVLVLFGGSAARAQAPIEASGHWEGAIQVEGRELLFEVDLTGSRGQLTGTMGIPAQSLRGLPLLKVAVDGQSVSFYARRDQTFDGTISADGKSISGSYVIQNFSIPFSLTRTGDARIHPPVRSQPISKDLEGTWNGTLSASGASFRVVLTMTNQADGSAVGRVVNLDEGGLVLPVAITQNGSSVKVEASGIGSFSGVLNAVDAAIVGTWTEGPNAVPLTFRRASGQ